jgi:Glycosyltransferase family 87
LVRVRSLKLLTGAPGALAAWAITRLTLFLMVRNIIPIGYPASLLGDVHLYRSWSATLVSGHFPQTQTWQYPPAAALVMLAPRALPFSYTTAFELLSLLADLLIMLMILRFTRRSGSGTAGLWAWGFGMALLGPVMLVRYDLMVSVAVVAALTLSEIAWVRGALIGLGIALKVWPVALLAGLRRWREVLTAGGAAVLAFVAICGVLAVVMRGAFHFLHTQASRGLQVESVAGLPFALAHPAGWWGVRVKYRYGAYEFVGGGTQGVATGAELATVLCAVGLLVWWLTARFGSTTLYDAAVTTTLLLIVTSRVLSPQYLVWLGAVCAVALAVPGCRQRLACRLTLLSFPLSAAIFPFNYTSFLHGGVLPTVLIVARNLLLVAAFVVSFVALWRSTRGRPAPVRGAGKPVAGVSEGSATVAEW